MNQRLGSAAGLVRDFTFRRFYSLGAFSMDFDLAFYIGDECIMPPLHHPYERHYGYVARNQQQNRICPR
jgi:hypothetical protein